MRQMGHFRRTRREHWSQRTHTQRRYVTSASWVELVGLRRNGHLCGRNQPEQHMCCLQIDTRNFEGDREDRLIVNMISPVRPPEIGLMFKTLSCENAEMSTTHPERGVLRELPVGATHFVHRGSRLTKTARHMLSCASFREGSVERLLHRWFCHWASGHQAHLKPVGDQTTT